MNRSVNLFRFGITLCLMLTIGSIGAYAHCDSYDGPVIIEAQKALKTNKVQLLYKWIEAADEVEITNLFSKTYKLRSGDPEIYTIVEKHFLETLVRLHRKSENAPYTGLKPAGQTEKIIVMSDQTMLDGDIEGFLSKLNGHIAKVVKEKFNKAYNLSKEKDDSVSKGREYVAAYVDFVHTVAGIHSMIDNSRTTTIEPTANSGHLCN